ncbi:MAG TPA: hypothetical protein DCZ03_03975 [Gammaproteobacteria bacterium]|nr:hypothetical protein [Gammaproteobacteria bacterium]
MKYNSFRHLLVFALMTGVMISPSLWAHPVESATPGFWQGMVHSLLSVEHWGVIFCTATLLYLCTLWNCVKRSLAGTALFLLGAVIGGLVPEVWWGWVVLAPTLFCSAIVALWRRRWWLMPAAFVLSLLSIQGFLHTVPTLLIQVNVSFGIGLAVGFWVSYLTAEFTIDHFLSLSRARQKHTAILP